MKPTPALGAALADAVRRVTAERKETSRDTRLALLERLGELGDPDQAGALVPLLQDFDIPVAQRAAAVLQQWTGKLHEIAPQPLPRPALPLAIELQEAGDPDVPARIKMRSGKTIRINLLPGTAPLTSVRFLRLVKSGYYNGLTFHRVVPNFVIQGGSPGANEYAGDALYVRDEIGLAAHTRGAVGSRRADATPATRSSSSTSSTIPGSTSSTRSSVTSIRTTWTRWTESPKGTPSTPSSSTRPRRKGKRLPREGQGGRGSPESDRLSPSSRLPPTSACRVRAARPRLRSAGQRRHRQRPAPRPKNLRLSLSTPTAGSRTRSKRPRAIPSTRRSTSMPAPIVRPPRDRR